MGKIYMTDQTKNTHNKPVTIIRVRRGINGFRYSVCDEDGYFISNMEKLSSARKRWEKEIRWGQVKLIRELDQLPDMSRNEATIRVLNGILSMWEKKSFQKKTV